MKRTISLLLCLLLLVGFVPLREAKAEPTTYTITLDSNGGGGSSGNIPGFVYGQEWVVETPSIYEITPPEGKEFDYWDIGGAKYYAGDTYTVTSDITAIAQWKDLIGYTVTVNNDGNGQAYASHTSGVTGTEVTLTASPYGGYQFKEWQVVSGGVTVTDNKFTIGTANVEIKAIFEEIAAPTYTVNVTNDGHGTGTASVSSGETGTEVTLTATPDSGYQFKEWQVVSGGVTVTDNKFTIGTANVEIKAIFEEIPAPTYTVTVTNDGHGTGTASVSSGETGTEVTLTATPDSGYQFKEWQVVSGGVTVTDNKFTIGMANVEIKAIFAEIPEPTMYTITLDPNGGGGLSGTIPVVSGQEWVIEAPSIYEITPPEGKEFDYWDIGGAKYNAGDTYTVTSDITAVPQWKNLPGTYSVTVSNDGNGTATATPAYGTTGTSVTLTATPNSGYQFKEWQIVSGGITVADNKFTIGMANVEVKAIFEKEATASPTPGSSTTPAPGTSATPMTTPTSGTPTTPTPTPTPVPTPTPEPSTVKKVQAKKSLKLTAPKIKKATYLWQYRTGKTGAWLSVRKGTKQKLSVKATMALDGYQYRCQVKAPTGTISYTDIYELYVYEPLKVRKQPKWGKICLPGTKRTISITAQGASSYQWVTRANGSSPWTKIEGATGTSYVVDVQEGMNNRQYACEISGKAGTARSKAAVVKIAPWPKVKITRQPQWKKPVATGSPVTLTVKALNAETYQWYYRTSKNGAWIIMGGETKTTLTFPAPANGNGYQYKCTAKGKGGTVDSKPVTLKVVTP